MSAYLSSGGICSSVQFLRKVIYKWLFLLTRAAGAANAQNYVNQLSFLAIIYLATLF
jgi:hypothetical protein